MMKKRFWKKFWYFYKWHILFLLLVVICVGFILMNVTQKNEPDLSICYIGKYFIHTQTFDDNKKMIEDLLHDANDDGKKVASLSAYPTDTESDLLEYFEGFVEKDTFDIFISERTAFTNCKDKSVFVTASEYVTLSKLPVETLKDENGRVYAVSLAECKYLEKLGIFDETDLFIAAVDGKDGEELTNNRKNGRNIAGYILTEE